MLRLLRLSAKNGALSSPVMRSSAPPIERDEVAGGWLDLDDVGAEVAELHGAERAAHDLREVDDAHAVEGEIHGENLYGLIQLHAMRLRPGTRWP